MLLVKRTRPATNTMNIYFSISSPSIYSVCLIYVCLKTSALKFGEELIIIDLRGIGSKNELKVSIFLLF